MGAVLAGNLPGKFPPYSEPVECCLTTKFLQESMFMCSVETSAVLNFKFLACLVGELRRITLFVLSKVISYSNYIYSRY